MDIKEYISSGIIESYVMGLASAEERTEFEALCRRFPELITARDEFEQALEKQAQSAAIKPDLELKEKVMSAFRKEVPGSEGRLLKLNKPNSGTAIRWIAAASIVLLLGAVWLAFDFYMQKKDAIARLESMEKVQSMMSDPNIMVVNLKGTDKAPQASASIYWDSTSSDVYLVVKNMPKLPSEKQYQLWALINNQPKDLGLFDMNKEGGVILKMVNTQKADAFAITIENRGNTGGPNTNTMQVMGKTNL